MDNGGRQTRERVVETCCPILELRQYIHQPGLREDFIALFDEYFIEEQERYGAQIIGQFRDRNDSDRFVWLRGFPNMETRHSALEGFYNSSPLWQEHRVAANDTISDVSDVLLLKPARATTSFRVDPVNRPAMGAQELAGGVIIATVYAFDAPVDAQFLDFFEKDVAPLLRGAGAALLGCFVTEPSENTFPALPVREGEHVFVLFASFADEAAYTAYRSALTQSQEWSASLASGLQGRLSKPEEVLELLPTRRSLLRFGSAEWR
ncbi:MAG: NIPSNAP family protein [Ktedonobacterales bacterium]